MFFTLPKLFVSDKKDVEEVFGTVETLCIKFGVGVCERGRAREIL